MRWAAAGLERPPVERRPLSCPLQPISSPRAGAAANSRSDGGRPALTNATDTRPARRRARNRGCRRSDRPARSDRYWCGSCRRRSPRTARLPRASNRRSSRLRRTVNLQIGLAHRVVRALVPARQCVTPRRPARKGDPARLADNCFKAEPVIMRGLPLRLPQHFSRGSIRALGRPQTDLSPGNARRDRYAMNVHEYQAKELLKEHASRCPPARRA